MRQKYSSASDWDEVELMEPSQELQPSARESRKRAPKRRKISFMKIGVIFCLGFCCLQFGKQFVQYQQIQAEVAYFEQVKQDKLDKQKELEETKALLDDPSYIERVAREHLGFVYEGETLVLPGETVDDDIPEYNPNIKAGDLH